MPIEIINCEQGGAEWFESRRGLPSASNFSAILAKGEGKTRRSYMYRLAAEIISGDPAETFTSQAMERGKVMEGEARELYQFLSDEPLTRVGFIKNGRRGASPDSLVGDRGGLEIKTQRGDLLVETLLKNDFPPEHKAQVQGNLWISERDWWDICVYWPNMPLFKARVGRDDAYITNLASEVDRFTEELDGVVAKIRQRK